jgi:hypothetical protein
MMAEPEATLRRLAAAEATLVSLLHLSGKSMSGLTTTPQASPAELMEVNKSFVDALNVRGRTRATRMLPVYGELRAQLPFEVKLLLLIAECTRGYHCGGRGRRESEGEPVTT